MTNPNHYTQQLQLVSYKGETIRELEEELSVMFEDIRAREIDRHSKVMSEKGFDALQESSYDIMEKMIGILMSKVKQAENPLDTVSVVKDVFDL